MLNVGARRVFLCRHAVDMRKSFDSLSDLVRIELGMDPFLGDVFVFLGKDRTRAKVLVWEQAGFWLCARRLETARFAPARSSAASARVLELRADELRALLEEVVPRAVRNAQP